MPIKLLLSPDGAHRGQIKPWGDGSRGLARNLKHVNIFTEDLGSPLGLLLHAFLVSDDTVLTCYLSHLMQTPDHVCHQLGAGDREDGRGSGLGHENINVMDSTTVFYNEKEKEVIN